MNFFSEMLYRPWTQWRLEQKIVLGILVLVGVFLVFYAISLVRHIAERRRESRDSVAIPIVISWEDMDGLTQHSQGRCLDLSPGGLRVELKDPLHAPTRIKFRVLETGATGVAVVRHCQRRRSKYVVGAQFTSLSQ